MADRDHPDRKNIVRYARHLWRDMVWAHRNQFDESPRTLDEYRQLWRNAIVDAHWAYDILTGKRDYR